MDLENRLPDESVNYSQEHPLKELAWLLAGVVGIVVAGAALLGFFAAEAAARLPFSVEREAVAPFVDAPRASRGARIEDAERALKSLADRVAGAMGLPPDMAIDVRLEDSPMVNAFASLGGQVRVHRGLVARMPDENTLAFVIAHEIAHVKLRHPVRSAGRGVAVGLLLAAVGFSAGSGVADVVVGAGGVTLLTFSRGQEEDADREALAALHALYGHVGGSRELFAVLSASGPGEAGRLAMLQTHPLSDDRVAAVETVARKKGWAADGPRTALSPDLSALRSARAQD